MYCETMAPYAGNEPLLIMTFQESLSSHVAAWFLQLEEITHWKGLTVAFLAQYLFNTESTLDYLDLQGMERKSGEALDLGDQGDTIDSHFDANEHSSKNNEESMKRVRRPINRVVIQKANPKEADHQGQLEGSPLTLLWDRQVQGHQAEGEWRDTEEWETLDAPHRNQLKASKEESLREGDIAWSPHHKGENCEIPFSLIDPLSFNQSFCPIFPRTVDVDPNFDFPCVGTQNEEALEETYGTLKNMTEGAFLERVVNQILLLARSRYWSNSWILKSLVNPGQALVKLGQHWSNLPKPQEKCTRQPMFFRVLKCNPASFSQGQNRLKKEGYLSFAGDQRHVENLGGTSVPNDQALVSSA
uniref:Retrotransposon gag domain-containing protein n=1 Tax=Fagus sylvatica TaxID=28930 RepID=A0A2N9H5J5_FAGSY